MRCLLFSNHVQIFLLCCVAQSVWFAWFCSLYYVDLQSLKSFELDEKQVVKLIDNFDAQYDYVTNEGLRVKVLLQLVTLSRFFLAISNRHAVLVQDKPQRAALQNHHDRHRQSWQAHPLDVCDRLNSMFTQARSTGRRSSHRLRTFSVRHCMSFPTNEC